VTEKEETVERTDEAAERSDTPDRADERGSPTDSGDGPLAGPADDVEAEAQRMVEIETMLRDQRDAVGVAVDREGEVGDDPPLRATVTGARREGPEDDPERVVFVGVDDRDRRLEFSVPWPADPGDESEPLVRLLSWYGLSVGSFASIIGEEVPLRLDRDGAVTVHVPPVPAAGNDLVYRIKRWGMARDLVTYSPGSLVRPGQGSPYSASRLWALFLGSMGLLGGIVGLVVVPALFTPTTAAAWLAYLLLVGLPAGLMGAIGVVLLPVILWVVVGWIRDRLFPG